MPGVPGDLIPPGVAPQVPQEPDAEGPPSINPDAVMSQVNTLPDRLASCFVMCTHMAQPYETPYGTSRQTQPEPLPRSLLQFWTMLACLRLVLATTAAAYDSNLFQQCSSPPYLHLCHDFVTILLLLAISLQEYVHQP